MVHIACTNIPGHAQGLPLEQVCEVKDHPLVPWLCAVRKRLVGLGAQGLQADAEADPALIYPCRSLAWG